MTLSPSSRTGTRFAYYLWVRWKSGEKDCFEINKGAAIAVNQNIGDWFNKTCLFIQTPSGQTLYIAPKEIAAIKIVLKEINPLNDDGHYENPLN